MTDATELADATASKDPQVGLTAVAALRALLESLEALQVDNARGLGWSWQQIAAALGVSKQAVHKKHGSGRRFGRRGAVMFERFTRSARETVVQAQAEARALGHDFIGTEHLLLGVAAAPGHAARVLAENGATAEALRAAVLEEVGCPALDGEALASIGIDLDEVRRRVEASFGAGALDRGRNRRRGRARCAGAVPFTPRAKKALELAFREAIARGERHIGAEHVLLGLLRDDRALAVGVLRRAGAPPDRVRAGLEPAGSRRGRGA